MRALFLILLSCLPCLAQLNVQQPMFAVRRASAAPENQTNLCYWWVASDLAPGAVSSWTDRNLGQTLIQPTAGNQPTASGSNIAFVTASSTILSNTLSRTFNNNPGWCVCWIASHGPNYGNSGVKIDNFIFNNSTLGFDYALNGGNPVFRDEVSGGFNYAIGAWTTNNTTHDIVIVSKPDNTIDCYTNGVFSANHNVGSAFNWSGNLVVGASATLVRPFLGNVYEIQFHTNLMSTTQITSWHNYGTNTYGYSP